MGGFDKKENFNVSGELTDVKIAVGSLVRLKFFMGKQENVISRLEDCYNQRFFKCIDENPGTYPDGRNVLLDRRSILSEKVKFGHVWDVSIKKNSDNYVIVIPVSMVGSDFSKTRDISKLEFLKTLQIEYLNAELRSKIYPNKRERGLFKHIMENKRAKIEDLADRNGIPTIFTNRDVLEEYRGTVYGDGGLPNFFYKDDEFKKKYGESDFDNYYFVGSDVTINDGTSVIVGELESIDDGIGVVKYDGGIMDAKLTDITRVI